MRRRDFFRTIFGATLAALIFRGDARLTVKRGWILREDDR